MFFVKKKKIAGDLSTSQRKSDNYCLEFFFSLFEKHKSKIITSFYREFIQLSEKYIFCYEKYYEQRRYLKYTEYVSQRITVSLTPF